MVLAMPVTLPQRPGMVLLRTGVTLDESIILRLAQMHVGALWIRYPGLDDLCRYVNPGVLDSYDRLTTEVSVALDAAMTGSSARLDYTSYKAAVMSVLERLTDNPSANVFLSELAGGDRPLVRHSANVCVLSLLMGLKLDFYLLRERSRLRSHLAKDLSGLGVGAMFHDIGMTRLPDYALARWNREHDEQDADWRDHVRLGHEMLKDHVDPTAAAVVLHHHQHYDGSGFPPVTDFSGVVQRQAGSDIHIFARICAVADIFDRLHHPAHAPGSSEAESPSIPAVRALRLMREKPWSDHIDPIIFRALLAVAPPFAPGSVVGLSDGRRAAVVSINATDPCRPIVEIVDPMASSSRKRRQRSERIDLSKGGISIARAQGHDVGEDLFFPAPEAPADPNAPAIAGRLPEGDLAAIARAMWSPPAA